MSLVEMRALEASPGPLFAANIKGVVMGVAKRVNVMKSMLVKMGCHTFFGALTLVTAYASSITAIDGDTVIADGAHIRLVNIDTPERGDRAKCDSERQLAELATLRMRQLLKSGTIAIVKTGRIDRYGRTLAFVKQDGRDIGAMLVAEGLAVRWEGRRHQWCLK